MHMVFDLSEINETYTQLASNLRQSWRQPVIASVMFAVCKQLFWSLQFYRNITTDYPCQTARDEGSRNHTIARWFSYSISGVNCDYIRCEEWLYQVWRVLGYIRCEEWLQCIFAKEKSSTGTQQGQKSRKCSLVTPKLSTPILHFKLLCLARVWTSVASCSV